MLSLGTLLRCLSLVLALSCSSYRYGPAVVTDVEARMQARGFTRLDRCPGVACYEVKYQRSDIGQQIARYTLRRYGGWLEISTNRYDSLAWALPDGRTYYNWTNEPLGWLIVDPALEASYGDTPRGGFGRFDITMRLGLRHQWPRPDEEPTIVRGVGIALGGGAAFEVNGRTWLRADLAVLATRQEQAQPVRGRVLSRVPLGMGFVASYLRSRDDGADAIEVRATFDVLSTLGVFMRVGYEWDDRSGWTYGMGAKIDAAQGGGLVIGVALCVGVSLALFLLVPEPTYP